MAAISSRMAVIFTVCALLAAACSAARSAQAPAVDCSSLVLTMADCLTFVMAGSTTKKPEGTCCSGLKTVLKTDSECLCEAFRNKAQLGITLNVTKAMTLPAACHVSAPSVTNCGRLPGVLWVLPDSYIDIKNKDYGGDKYINGEIIPCQHPTYQPKQARNSKYKSKAYVRKRDGPPAAEQRKPKQEATPESAS